jgi:hypothetical protein
MYSTLCQYCGVGDKGWYRICDKYGILWCENHKGLAERDGRAWLSRNDKVAWGDATKDPLFTETELFDKDVTVRRSSGALETKGWRLCKPSFDEPAFIQRDSTGWWMPALNTDTQIGRGILIEDLKLSLSEDRWGLVDAFILRLNTGFYKAEAAAYMEALESWRKMAAEAENPGATGVGVKAVQSGIKEVYHPSLGFGRIVEVPKQVASVDVKEGDPLSQ